MLAIAGGKGGCGKTTATLGLGRALLNAGQDPLLVDADTDLPDLHLVTDVEREPTATALAAGTPLEQVYQRPPGYPGLRVVTAGRPGTTADALARARDWHGPVLVDCPAGAGPDAATPLSHCDRSIVITTDRPETVADVEKTAVMAERLDATVAGTLVRGGPTTLPFASAHVESVPDVETARGTHTSEDVLTHPGYRAGCASLVGALSWTGPARHYSKR